MTIAVDWDVKIQNKQKKHKCFFPQNQSSLLKTIDFPVDHAYMGLVARKPVFGGLRTPKAQTSLRIRAVWSAPLLFA